MPARKAFRPKQAWQLLRAQSTDIASTWPCWYLQVLSGTDLIAEGKIKARAQPPSGQSAAPEADAAEPEWPFEANETVDAAAFYREMGRAGLTYGPDFRMVKRTSVDGGIAHMRWVARNICSYNFLGLQGLYLSLLSAAVTLSITTLMYVKN